jgi:RHS repeat-associated protein
MLTGAGRAVTYASFNMAEEIVQSSTTIKLQYGSEHNRIRKVDGSTDTFYLNDPASGAMTEHAGVSGTVTWNDYVIADDQLVAERSNTTGTITMYYFVLDHLGSVSVVTDATGTPLATGGRLSYDAWGKMRLANGQDDPTCSTPAQSVPSRGYTSQEEIKDVCLVNMNARIYDPQIGRFMSADSIVPAPFYSQAFNRYSYGFNAPLVLTDPSGNVPGVDEVVIGTIPDDPVLAAILAVVDLVADIFTGDLFFGAGAHPPVAVVASVSIPNPAQSPTAGGNSTATPQMQNAAPAPQEAVTPTPSSTVAANSAGSQTAAASNYAQADTETIVVTGTKTATVTVPQTAGGIVAAPAVEQVVVTHDRLVQQQYNFNFNNDWMKDLIVSPAQAAEGPPNPNDTNGRGQCSSLWLNYGNDLRGLAHRTNQVSSALIGWGAGAAVAGVPALPATAGTSEVPAAAMVGLGLGGYQFAAGLDAVGALVQSAASGDPSAVNATALEQGWENQVVQIAPPLAVPLNVYNGALDTIGPAPTPMSCH